MVYIIPATPVDVHVASWPLLIVVLCAASLISGVFGLVIGTVFQPEQVPLIFSIIVIPVIFLRCVYYPWALLDAVKWLQIATLVNPVVYLSEGLRAALTPDVPHMPPLAFLSAMVLVLAGLGTAGILSFLRRVRS